MTRFILVSALCILLGANGFAQERFIEIDNRKVLINTIGFENRQEGQPVIVFESGLGTPMDHWDRILNGASQLGPLLIYDRPGIGKSEADDEMPTVQNVSNKLIRILEQLELSPPYLLVGHSLGGVYVRGFAVYHPEMLAGLVIIDPADFTETQQNKRDYYDFLGWNEERIDRMVAEIEQNLERRHQGAPRSIREEGEVLSEMRRSDFNEIRNHPLPNIPVHIITGGRFDMPDHLRSKEYDDEAIFRSKMKHRIARWTDVIQSVNKGMLFYSGDAGHFVHYDDPELVISSIKIVLQDYNKITGQR